MIFYYCPLVVNGHSRRIQKITKKKAEVMFINVLSEGGMHKYEGVFYENILK